MQTLRGVVVSLRGFGRIWIRTEPMPTTERFYFRLPCPFGLVPINSFESTSVVLRAASVRIVLRLTAMPEIAASVVKNIAIDVVNVGTINAHDEAVKLDNARKPAARWRLPADGRTALIVGL